MPLRILPLGAWRTALRRSLRIFPFGAWRSAPWMPFPLTLRELVMLSVSVSPVLEERDSSLWGLALCALDVSMHSSLRGLALGALEVSPHSSRRGLALRALRSALLWMCLSR